MVRWQISVVLGVAAAVAVTAAGLLATSSDIAVDLGTRAGQVLSGEATSWAAVDVHGRDLVLRGDAPSEDLRQLAIERLKRIYGVRSVEAGSAGLLPEVSPYLTAFERSGRVVTLTGAVPSLPDRARILSGLASAEPGMAISDHSVLARGKPDERYADAVRALFPLPALLAKGKIAIEDRRVTITGEAVDNAAYDQLRSLNLDLPDGYTLARTDLVRPLASPFAWSIDRDDADVQVSGFVPDPAARDELVGLIRDAVGPRGLHDTLDYASGAPSGFSDTAADAIDYLDLLASGHIGITDQQVVISGRAASPEAYRTLNAYLETWAPTGFDVQKSISLPIVNPYTLTVSRSHGRVTVSGFVPSDAVRDDITTAAGAVAGETPAVVETTLADGAPASFGGAATFAVNLLAKLDEGTALLSGAHITLAGVATSAGNLIELDAETANPPSGFDVAVNVTPPLAIPYVWSVVKESDRLVVSGAVPSEAIRTAIRAVLDATSDDLSVVDRSALGAGLDPAIDLVAVARKAADLLTGLDGGEVRFVEGVMSIKGKAATADAVTAIDADLATLPVGVIKGGVDIIAPASFHFFVERGFDTVTLDGDLVDDGMRAAVLAAAGRAFGKADVLDSMAIAKAAPASARDAALFAIRAASLLAKGSVSVEGDVIRVDGSAFTGVGATRFSSEIAGSVPEGYTPEVGVGALPPEAPLDAAACGTTFSEVLHRGAIYFDAGTATIATDSRGLVDRLGAIALRCPAARLMLSATAAGSDPASASVLAEARARTVAAAFADVGVDPSRLAVTGVAAAADGLDILVQTP